MTIAHEPLVTEILTKLDTQACEVTDWEAAFVDSLLRQTYPLTPKQRKVLARMAETYLDPALAAELLGQQRLFT